VLVLSADPLAAALVGALVEIEGQTPAFAARDEVPRDALRRVRPHVLLADCGAPDGCGPALIGPAKMVGARVVLFGHPRIAALVDECATLYRVAVLPIPPGPGDMRRALAPAAAIDA
jgi:hypothetical protein